MPKVCLSTTMCLACAHSTPDIQEAPPTIARSFDLLRQEMLADKRLRRSFRDVYWRVVGKVADIGAMVEGVGMFAEEVQDIDHLLADLEDVPEYAPYCETLRALRQQLLFAVDPAEARRQRAHNNGGSNGFHGNGDGQLHANGVDGSHSNGVAVAQSDQ